MSNRFNYLPLLLAVYLLPAIGMTQDFNWWNEKHNWDGVSNWQDYIILAPDYMGPNALPVPEFKNGTIEDKAFINLAFERHQSEGDQTQNLFSRIFIPLFSPRVGLNFQMVPWEQYELDTLTRDRRRARSLDPEGTASGDLYVGTHIQLIQDHKFLPDALLTINLKTASGSKLSDARFTDTPGYFFDLSLGRKFSLNEKGTENIRPFVMAGFYVWQLHISNNRQNDAFLYAFGFDVDLKKFKLRHSAGGYNGYFGEGDRPFLYRFDLQTKFDSKLNYQLRFQQGIRDFDYTTIRLGFTYDLSSLGKLLSSI